MNSHQLTRGSRRPGLGHGARAGLWTPWMVALAAALLLWGATPALAESTIYVRAGAVGANNGASWADAYTDLQDALAAAVAGDEIWVSADTYRPAGFGGSRGDTFQLIDGVEIYGGFPAAGNPGWADRDPALNQTILSGDLNGDDGPNFANNTENSYHVVTASGTDATAVLDGFTVTAGHADGNGSDGVGGGMYNDSGSPTLTDCTFTENAATDAGGMYTFSGSPTLAHCAFTGNVADNWAGGMSNMSSDPAMTNCTFTGNSASYAGGMFNASSSPALADCTFIGNSALFFAGGMFNDHSGSSLTDCTFSGNSATAFAGGMYNYESTPTLVNCVFTGNLAAGDVGGGMYNDASTPTLINCAFAGNKSATQGGGVFNLNSNPTLTNCILWGNTDSGGTDESAQIDTQGGTPVVSYCCIEGWTGALGGAGNIGSDPLFVDVDGADNTLGTEDDNLRLGGGSPAGDAGDNTAVPPGVSSDLDGSPRLVDDPNIPNTGNGDCPLVDMGAYERQTYADTDNDNVEDGCDGCPNDPDKAAPGICGCNVPDDDTDGDNTADCNDGCPNDGSKTAAGQCGCNNPDTDTDGDGTGDCNDGCPNDGSKTAAGQCGCNNPDTDTDGDGTGDCNDGCPNDPDKTAAGLCNCGVADTDTDSDGAPDCADLCPADAGKIAPGNCGCGVEDVDSDGDSIIDTCGTEQPAPACGCGAVSAAVAGLWALFAAKLVRRRRVR